MNMDRVYRDYPAMENFVVRVVSSCITRAQLVVAHNVYKRAMKIVERYHPTRLSEFDDKISSMLIVMMKSARLVDSEDILAPSNRFGFTPVTII